VKPEAQLERLFAEEVRKAGGMAIKLAPTHVGLPDRLVIRPGGTLVLVELKTDNGKLSPAQVVWHARAAALGCTVIVLRGEAEVRGWVADLG
jgi:hypothetical protein